MSLTRRQLLKGAGLFATAALLSPAERLFAFQQVSQTSINHLEAYLSALETPYDAPLNIHFESVLQRNSVGLILYDLDNTRLVTAMGSENPLPVASAFKGPVLMYFIDRVEPSVWSTVPVEYWDASSSQDVPEAYQADWQENRTILRALYQMLVLSDNITTGTVLSYVARLEGSEEPLVLFNDWARDRVGVSQLSALSAWDNGIENGMSPIDSRYLERGTSVGGQVLTFENLMTARDLGLFYIWMVDQLSSEGQRVCRDLMSTIRDNRGANLERLAMDLGGTPYSKNGSLITDEGTIITDAGLMTLSDNHQYLLVMLSFDATSIIPTMFEELNDTLRGRYNELIHNHHYDGVSVTELRDIYAAHLAIAYPQRAESSEGLYRYGFIIPEGVDVFSTPDESNPLRNPVIRSTRFGIHLLMQGALVRFVDVDANWVELMPDDHRDNVRARLGTRLFLRRSDVWAIALDYSQPIAQLTTQEGIQSTDKFIIINLVARELVAFEGAEAVLRVPIVLNSEATPRGVQVITSKWFARSMQPWAPGVPFTSFFGSEGFALHGSPWQRWSTTVNQENITGRSSAGCVNIPDWMVTAGEYNRPADELLFRWIGGMENVQDRVFDYPSETFPALRIFSVDYPHNLRSYHRPESMVRFGASWDDVISAMEAAPLQAPNTFFV
ncbi:MAG: serine hydrolase [Aggregatilineales bacterium]